MPEHITIDTQPLPEAPPTVTHYQQFIAEAIAALDKILSVIPKLDEAEASARKVANSRLGVPAEFITTVVVAVEQSPELAALKKLDPIAVRDLLQYAEAVRPLRDKLVTVTKRVVFGLRYVHDDIAGQAQQIYRIAKQLASDGRSPLMDAHVANMKRDLGRRIASKAEREERKLAKLMEAAAELQQTQEVQKAA